MLSYRDDIYSDASESAFGPGTDLFVALLAILLVMLTTLRLTSISIFGEVDTSYLTEAKKEFWSSVESVCNINTNEIEVVAERGASQSIPCGTETIEISDFATYYTLSFGDGVLFESGEANLSLRGADLLGRVRDALSATDKEIMEVQVLGHTDSVGEPTVNLNLGWSRARAVYLYLIEEELGLDPSQVLVSATSYGEYRPANRDPRDIFDYNQLNEANGSAQLRSENRRIEVSVYFRPVNTEQATTEAE